MKIELPITGIVREMRFVAANATAPDTCHLLVSVIEKKKDPDPETGKTLAYQMFPIRIAGDAGGVAWDFVREGDLITVWCHLKSFRNEPSAAMDRTIVLEGLRWDVLVEDYSAMRRRMREERGDKPNPRQVQPATGPALDAFDDAETPA